MLSPIPALDTHTTSHPSCSSCPFTHAPRITGPILDQSHVSVGSDVQAPELTSRLFQLGSKMLLARMGDILSERGRGMAREQDSSVATYARKVWGNLLHTVQNGAGCVGSAAHF